MAKINIIKPRYGDIFVLDDSLSNYRVRYVPPGSDVEFHGFKVFCHACSQYLYTTGPEDNPATFDIQALLNTGHPGDFDISANTSAEVEFLVTTESADPAMGTTTPAEQWIPAQVGHNVTYSIKATANPGYKFVKWVSSTGNEYTGATHSFSVKVEYGGTDYRHYVAYFAPQDYNYNVAPEYHISADPVSGRNPDGFKHSHLNIEGVERRERLYYGSNSNTFAYIHGVPYKYTLGQRITVSLEITNRAFWDSNGLRLVGWRIAEYYADETVVDDDGSYSVSFTADFAGSTTGTAWYTVYAIICTSDFHKLEFACEPSDAAELYIKNDDIYRRGIGSQVVMMLYGSDVNLEVMALLGRYAALGFIHGWSVQLPDSQHPIGAPIVAKSYTMPNVDAKIVVYICTHRLVCTDDGANLECKPPELLNDCSVPPGTTVYD